VALIFVLALVCRLFAFSYRLFAIGYLDLRLKWIIVILNMYHFVFVQARIRYCSDIELIDRFMNEAL